MFFKGPLILTQVSIMEALPLCPLGACLLGTETQGKQVESHQLGLWQILSATLRLGKPREDERSRQTRASQQMPESQWA